MPSPLIGLWTWGAGSASTAPTTLGPFWATSILVRPIRVYPVDVQPIHVQPGKVWDIDPNKETFRDSDEG